MLERVAPEKIEAIERMLAAGETKKTIKETLHVGNATIEAVEDELKQRKEILELETEWRIVTGALIGRIPMAVARPYLCGKNTPLGRVRVCRK